MIPFAVGIIYVTIYIMAPDSILPGMFKAPEMACALFAAFMESLIIVHLFPSNDSYGDFWKASSIGAGIMDDAGNLRFSSDKVLDITADQVRAARDSSLILGGGDTALSSKKIHGGFCYWLKDLSEINGLNSKLADIGDVLSEENAMIDAENKMNAERIRTEQQSRLYDRIAVSVRPQLDKLDRLLQKASGPMDEETFEATMKYACLLNAYIKRYSNLIFVSDGRETIAAGELTLAMYRKFEEALETAMPGAAAVVAHLAMDGKEARLETEIVGRDFARGGDES